MPRPLSLLLALVACCAVLGLAAPTSGSAATRAEIRLIGKINDARAARGLSRLRASARLGLGAHRWSRYLLSADSFVHARLASGTGEILAWGTCSYITPGAAVRMWLNSSSHRPLLLSRSFRYVGTGWAVGSWCGYRCVKMAVARFR
jgi:uncharacterized protein YkwD